MIKLEHPVDTKEIKRRLHLKKYAYERDRLKTILWAQQGIARSVIAKQLDKSSTFVTKWIKKFNPYGLDGLADQPRSGAACKLNEEASRVLDFHLQQGPSKASGLSRYRIKDLVALLKPFTGEVSYETVRKWVKKKVSHGSNLGQNTKKMT